MVDKLEQIQTMIYEIRGQKVMLDLDLAVLYQVETKYLNRTVKRHLKRFPADFMFQLDDKEWEILRCQIGTAKKAEKIEYTLAKQLLRSGTSIGANLSEAQYSVSRKEFLVKAKISLKECAETEYWLDLLKETGLINQKEYDSIMPDYKDILRLLIASVKTIQITGS